MNQNDVHDPRFGYLIGDLAVGQVADYSKTLTRADVEAFARISGDDNPMHLDEAFAARCRPGGRIVHGMLTSSLISTIIGTRLPGPGCLFLGLSIRYLKPVREGETVTARLTVRSIDHRRSRVVLDCECRVAGALVVSGEAETWVPSRRPPG